MAEQLSHHSDFLRRMIRIMQDEQRELDLIILRTPTGQVREDLTEGNIHLLAAISALLNVV